MVRTWSWRAPVELKERESRTNGLPSRPTDIIEITVPEMKNYTLAGGVHVLVDERLSPGQLSTTTVFDPTDTLAQAVCDNIRTVKEGVDVATIQDQGHVNGSQPTTSIVGEIVPTWEQHQRARANQGEPLRVELQLIVKVAPGSNVTVRAAGMDCFAGQGLGRVAVESTGRVAREDPSPGQVLPLTNLYVGAENQSNYEYPPVSGGGDTHVVELPPAVRSGRRAGTSTDPEELRKSQRVEWPTVAIPSRRPTRGSITVTDGGASDRLVIKVFPREDSESGARLAGAFAVDWLPREDAALKESPTGDEDAAKHRVPVLGFKPPRRLGEESPSGYAGAAVDIEVSAPWECPIGVQLGPQVAPDWELKEARHAGKLLVNPVGLGRRLQGAQPTPTPPAAAPEPRPSGVLKVLGLGAGTGKRRKVPGKQAK